MLSTVRCRRAAAAATLAALQQRRNAAAEVLPKKRAAPRDGVRAQEREVGICVSVPMTSSSVRCPNPPPLPTHFCNVRFVPFIRYGNRSPAKESTISCYRGGSPLSRSLLALGSSCASLWAKKERKRELLALPSISRSIAF